MSVRSFTVFQDSPSVLPDDHTHHASLPATDVAATLLSTLAAIEKENLHPVTGLRAGPPTASESKKRKTGALATKVLAVPASKKHKEHCPEPKKTRKPLAATGKHRTSDAKKHSSKTARSCKTSPLPPVAEEHESRRQPPPLSISQLDIDSRCYELTVSPLADVSDAYDATRTSSQEPDVHADKEHSAEPAIRSYFSPSISDKPLPSTNDTCNIDESSRHANEFSTPERQRIYSAFTFSSPSPTSERFKQAQSSPTNHASLVPESE